MKEIKHLLYILLLLLTGCKDNAQKYIAFIGTKFVSSQTKLDAYKLVSNELNLECLNLFSKQNDRYEDILNVLDKNPNVTYKNKTNRVSNYLEQSKYIAVNFSYNNVLRNAKIYDNNFIYLEKDFNYDKENFAYFLNEILENLSSYNSIIICCFLFDIYNLEESSKYVYLMNDVIVEKCQDYGIKYVDTSAIEIEKGYIDDLTVNNFSKLLLNALK